MSVPGPRMLDAERVTVDPFTVYVPASLDMEYVPPEEKTMGGLVQRPPAPPALKLQHRYVPERAPFAGVAF